MNASSFPPHEATSPPPDAPKPGTIGEHKLVIALLLMLILAAVALTTWLLLAKGQRAGTPESEPLPAGPQAAHPPTVITLTAAINPTPTVNPSPTPTQPPPIPLLWAKNGIGGYLHEQPGAGRLLAFIHNGERLELLGSAQLVGETTWEHIRYREQVGWLPRHLIYPVGDPPVAFVTAEQGAFLRAEPQGGRVVAVLQQGTPVRRILESRDGWVRVQLLDENEGWVFAELLSGERSAP